MYRMIFRKLYLIGDSLTQLGYQECGWVSAVANHYQRRYDVINRGFNGYNTDYIRRILPGLLRRDEVKLRNDVAAAAIFLGANDAVLAEHSKRNVPLDRYADNLRAISHMLRGEGVDYRQQVIIGVPPVIESKWRKHRASMRALMNLKNCQTAKYARMCEAVASELGTAYIELYKSIMAENSWSEFFLDGLHFSPLGDRFLAEKVCTTLDTMLPRIEPLYPEYSDIDASDPDSSLSPWY